MKSFFLTAFLAITPLAATAQDFDTYFENATLRLDYVFCGDAGHQAIYFQGATRTGLWAGRRHNLEAPLLRGNGIVVVRENGRTIYSNSFSTLFQEWQSYEEAAKVQKAFENTFQIPFPKRPVTVEITLTDTHGKVSASITHEINPADILIRRMQDNGSRIATIHQGGSLSSAIDIAILSEGYTASEQEKFFADALRARDALMRHEPFASLKGRFNLRAVFVPSEASGPSIPHKGIWNNTVAGSHFDTFYSERYLTTSSMHKVYDALSNVPFEHVIVLVNTPVYGGGGIYNSITVMGSDHKTFNEVLVHEFGHAFGGLGDEYFYDDMYETMYPADTEPWEPNLTTLVDFDAKWKDMLPFGTAIPTETDMIERQDVRPVWKTFTPEQKALLNLKVGVYEGGGYQSKGVYRPVQECRMKINECEEFCPVCSRALIRTIDYYTQ